MVRFFQAILFLLLIGSSAFAGNTGKLLGTVIDQSSGEPLPGANIIIEGTSLGASSDANGEYFVLNIQPGTYVVECSMIGYATKRVENVVINADQSRIINFQMSEETLELEQITVVADRPLVQKDLTASKKITSAEEIAALPVETFTDVMLTQAGVTQGAGGELHIKGGRSNEIAYLVDGVSVANPYSTNGLSVTVANNAIQEMSVVSGAFNAEYGNAMSGIVNLTTKDGGQKYKAFLSFYSGDFVSSHDDIFLNIDDIDAVANRNIEGTFSGPLSFLGSNDHTFFLSGRYSKSEGYLYGRREHLPSDSANFDLKTETISYKDDFSQIVTITRTYDEWYIELGGDNAIVPMNPSEGLNLMGKLKFKLTPNMTLRTQSLFNQGRSKSYSHLWKFNPEGLPTSRSWSAQNSLLFTHTLSPKTFYELKAAVNFQRSTTYLYEDPGDPRYVPTDKVQGSPAGVQFLFGGTSMGHSYSNSFTYLGKFDITSQVNNRHLVKAGLEARLYELDRENFTILYDRNRYKQPTVLGLDSPTHDAYVTYPRQMSAYIQDKIEYDDFIINAGLRYDYFFSDFDYAVDVLQPDGELKEAEHKHMVAPRLGASFPITATGIIHFSYGHFFQMPSLANLYVNPEFEVPVSGSFTFGNANLNPQKTVIYEMGLQQQISDRYAIDVTGFYKDIRDLLATQSLQFRALSGDIRNYSLYRNLDYANVKGLTLSFTKRMMGGDPVAANIDYTFQVAEGNDNDPSAFYFSNLSGQTAIRTIIPLDWDQQHVLNASVTVRPFQGFLVSAIGQMSTGYPYSPFLFNSTYDAEPNSDRKPTYKGVDLRMSYNFAFKDINYQFFVKIYNLFDSLNERFVFNDTGRAGYTFANRSADEPKELIEKYDTPGVHTYEEYITRPDFYRAPREIRVGMSIDL